MNSNTTAERRWVAFGPSGAVGSIRHTSDGYAVQMIGHDAERGVYPTLDAAKGALHASMQPGSDWPDFREH